MLPHATSPPARGRFRGAVAIAAPLLLAVSLVLGGCQRAGDAPANVVLITVDTLRADRLGPYGYAAIQTPAIARLAEAGVLFEKAFADTSWTLPSLSSVMTGSYPSEHKVRSWNDTLAPAQHTLAEVLAEHGYATAAVVGSYPLDRFFGFAQGFSHYDDEMTQPLFADGTADADTPAQPSDDSQAARNEWRLMREKSNAYRTDQEVADAAIAWLAANPRSPMFLWVHFFGPHEKGKHTDPDPALRKAREEAQIARYDVDVAEMDRQVGRFLDAVRADPRYPNTAVILHSDHGQSLREHGLFGHGFDLYDTTVHVPLIVRLPGDRDAGTRVSRLVRNLDIFATVLDIAGIDDAESDGRASRSLLASADGDDHVYLETYPTLAFSARDVEVGDRTRKVGQIMRGIRTDAFKLISREPFLADGEDRADPLSDDYVRNQTSVSLYDYGSDPGEKVDAAAARPRHTAHLRELLGGYDAGRGAPTNDSGLSDAARERLRSLGYNP